MKSEREENYGLPNLPFCVIFSLCAGWLVQNMTSFLDHSLFIEYHFLLIFTEESDLNIEVNALKGSSVLAALYAVDIM